MTGDQIPIGRMRNENTGLRCERRINEGSELEITRAPEVEMNDLGPRPSLVRYVAYASGRRWWAAKKADGNALVESKDVLVGAAVGCQLCFLSITVQIDNSHAGKDTEQFPAHQPERGI